MMWGRYRSVRGSAQPSTAQAHPRRQRRRLVPRESVTPKRRASIARHQSARRSCLRARRWSVWGSAARSEAAAQRSFCEEPFYRVLSPTIVVQMELRRSFAPIAAQTLWPRRLKYSAVESALILTSASRADPMRSYTWIASRPGTPVASGPYACELQR